jgi:hypothetical protein
MESTPKKRKLNQDEIQLLMIEIKRKYESNVFVIFYVKSGRLITPSCED